MKKCSSRISFKIFIIFGISVFLLALFIGFSSMVACAATLTVTTTNDVGPGSLRSAIGSAVTGDVIDFDVEGTITLESELEVTKGITIQGPGADKLEVSGNDTTRVFDIDTTESVNISDISIVSGNSGTFGGGGISINESRKVRITSCTFSMNVALSDSNGSGGAIYSFRSNATLIECTFSENGAKVNGGAIFSLEGSLTLTDCTFEGNTAELYGGAIYNNYASGSTIESESTTITGCTFNGNRSTPTGYGGAIYNSYVQNVEIINSTFFENNAFSGGGISNKNSSPFIINCTFANNSAIVGSGLYNIDSDPFITNCIFWNKDGEEIENDSTSTPELYYCVVRNNKVGIGTIVSNIKTADPMLRDLKYYRGPTKTCALGDGSSAIDSGTASVAPSTDQRGVTRPQGKGYDIGAFEISDDDPKFTRGAGTSGCNTAALVPSALLLFAPLFLLARRR